MQAKVQAKALVKQHLLVTGQTGSGKTTAALNIIEELKQNDQTVIILDPTGEYSHQENMVVYKLGENCYIDPGSLTAPQLLSIMDIEDDNLMKKVANAITSLKIQANLHKDKTGVYIKNNRSIKEHNEAVNQLESWMRNYNYDLLSQQVIEEYVLPYGDERADYRLLGQVYDWQKINQAWDQILDLEAKNHADVFRQIFGTRNQKGRSKLEISYVLTLFTKMKAKKRALVIDISELKKYPQSQKQVLSLIMQVILQLRMEQSKSFPITVFLDEAHRYLPNELGDLSENGMFQLLREGRKYGLNLALITQSPLDLPASMLGQFSNFLIHHLATTTEEKSLQIPNLDSKKLAALGVGQAVVCLDNAFVGMWEGK